MDADYNDCKLFLSIGILAFSTVILISKYIKHKKESIFCGALFINFLLFIISLYLPHAYNIGFNISHIFVCTYYWYDYDEKVTSNNKYLKIAQTVIFYRRKQFFLKSLKSVRILRRTENYTILPIMLASGLISLICEQLLQYSELQSNLNCTHPDIAYIPLAEINLVSSTVFPSKTFLLQFIFRISLNYTAYDIQNILE